MNQKSAANTWIVGLALFAMFFGSGNLIFPLIVGSQAGSLFYVAAAGFVLTAAFLPCLGVLAMVVANGNYEKLFEGFIPKKWAQIFLVLLLLAWIPFGSGPRCVVLAHVSLSTFFPMPPLWLFALIFLGLVYWFLYERNHVLDMFGKVLTPALLVSILAILANSFGTSLKKTPEISGSSIFFQSLMDGYFTQDLIASIFFSSSIVAMLYERFHKKEQVLSLTMKGGIIAILLLGGVYGLLMAAAAFQADNLAGQSGIALVSKLAEGTLGSGMGSIASIAVSLACFTTEVALALVLADFLKKNLFHKKHAQWANLISLIVIFFMSLLQFDGIMAIMTPAMMVLYPMLFVLVVRYLIISFLKLRALHKSALKG